MGAGLVRTQAWLSRKLHERAIERLRLLEARRGVRRPRIRSRRASAIAVARRCASASGVTSSSSPTTTSVGHRDRREPGRSVGAVAQTQNARAPRPPAGCRGSSTAPAARRPAARVAWSSPSRRGSIASATASMPCSSSLLDHLVAALPALLVVGRRLGVSENKAGDAAGFQTRHRHGDVAAERDASDRARTRAPINRQLQHRLRIVVQCRRLVAILREPEAWQVRARSGASRTARSRAEPGTCLRTTGTRAGAAGHALGHSSLEVADVPATDAHRLPHAVLRAGHCSWDSRSTVFRSAFYVPSAFCVLRPAFCGLRTQAEAYRADCETMVGARTFADVLDRHLHLEPPTYARLAGIATPSIWPAAAPSAAGEFRRRDECRVPGCVSRAAAAPPADSRNNTPHCSRSPQPPREHLEPVVRSRSAEARVPRAARRLHPDAHPGAEGAARRQLEAAFAAARDAYLTLLVLTTH